MAIFLKAVEGTSYGSILREIDEYFKKRAEQDDYFVRQMKNRLQATVDKYREEQEKEVNGWFDGSIDGLKKISTLYATFHLSLTGQLSPCSPLSFLVFNEVAIIGQSRKAAHGRRRVADTAITGLVNELRPGILLAHAP